MIGHARIIIEPSTLNKKAVREAANQPMAYLRQGCLKYFNKIKRDNVLNPQKPGSRYMLAW